MTSARPDESEDPMDRTVARCEGCEAVLVVGRRGDGDLYPIVRGDSCCGVPELVALED